MDSVTVSPVIDLRALRIPEGGAVAGQGPLEVEPLDLAGQQYTYLPPAPEMKLEIGRTIGPTGWFFRLRGACRVQGPCWVCLGDASLPVQFDAREVHDPSTGDPEAESLYVADGMLDVADWARDAILEQLPPRIVCREDCRGLCPHCGADLNAGDCDCAPQHSDPRWGPLAELAERLRDDTPPA